MTPALATIPIDARRLFQNAQVESDMREVCGMTGPVIGPRIFNGEEVGKGDWPWVVAIFIDEASRTGFTCGGTIISAQTVLTAGHCIKLRSGKTYKSGELFVVAAIHNVKHYDVETSVVNRVTKAEIHSDFDHTLSSTYDADIAVLILQDRFT